LLCVQFLLLFLLCPQHRYTLWVAWEQVPLARVAWGQIQRAQLARALAWELVQLARVLVWELAQLVRVLAWELAQLARALAWELVQLARVLVWELAQLVRVLAWLDMVHTTALAKYFLQSCFKTIRFKQ
jgi:hypothetical protein